MSHLASYCDCGRIIHLPMGRQFMSFVQLPRTGWRSWHASSRAS